MTNRWGNNGNSDRLYILGLQNHCRWWLQPWNEKMLFSWKKSYDQPRQHIRKQRHYFANKGPSSQGYGFSGSHVWLWEFDHKEFWAPKIWCFWTMVLEKTLESPLDCKEIQPVHPKGNQSWIVMEGLMLKLQYFSHVMRRADLFENTLMLGKIEGGRRRGWQKVWWVDGIIDSMDMSLSKPGSWWWTGKPDVLQPLGLRVDRIKWLNWTVPLYECWVCQERLKELTFELPGFVGDNLEENGFRGQGWERTCVAAKGATMAEF